MRLPRQNRLAAFAVFVSAVALAGGLTACTADSPVPSSSTTQPVPSKPAQTPSDVPTEGSTIEPVLVVASVDVDGKHVSASGYIQGVVEDGGSCVFSYEREGKTVTAQQQGTADRMTTSCGLVQSPIEDFVRGSWTLTLSYESKGEKYTSQPATVEIP
ncbi:hypothetical protein ACFVWR_03575 [Leifsonia sp. NPDC058292]|uniref:hypothetical protein n=1 Tax=Leifsonia sp. NPDC058292 TaxID=3346428 RepID=UPI0036DCFAEC